MKKTNKILTNVLLGALTLSSLGLANVQAEEVVPTTEASVTIQEGNITHYDAGTGLTFTVPGFSFEKFFGASSSSTSSDTTTGNITLNVDDQRSLNGITNGWKVSAKLSLFENTDDKEVGKSLGKQTYISLSSDKVNPTLVTPYEGVEIGAPTVNPNDIKLLADNQSDILIWSAYRGENKLQAVGVDKWSLTFPAENISLTIPNNELVGGNHSATITWTLSPVFSETLAE